MNLHEMERIYQGVMINKMEVLTLFPYVLGTPSYLETFSNISWRSGIHGPLDLGTESVRDFQNLLGPGFVNFFRSLS